ncbi:hypothetical protein ACFVAV_33865 [Nocardia sp. NPDC057663]|uniref:hypothetical protein n=1 Tax=Nocardia sp. NPDC057663 TaxID=3346201 RepID=UPI00367001C2
MTIDTATTDLEEIDQKAAAVDADGTQQQSDSARRDHGAGGRSGLLRSVRWLSGLSRRATISTLVVLALLLCVVTATTVVFARSTADHQATAEAVRGARAAAESTVPKVLSYDHATIDREFPAVSESLTGKFRDDFGKLGSSVIIPAAHRDSIVTTATIVGTAVVSATSEKVTLLLFLNQETTSTKYQGPRLDGSRVRVTMDDAAGSWLISDITPV